MNYFDKIVGIASAVLVIVAVSGCSGTSKYSNSNESGEPEGAVTLSLQSIEPQNGTTEGGTEISIAAEGAVLGATVKIGDKDCLDVLVSSEQIRCTTPPAEEGIVDILVTNPTGEGALLEGEFTYITPDPTVATEVSPIVGSTSGGTLIRITGDNFAVGATLKIGDKDCTSVLVSKTEIACTAPASTAGTVDISITLPSGSTIVLEDAYTYQVAPTISGVTPASGTKDGGTVLTVSGTGFRAGANVLLGSLTCNSINVNSETSMTCTSPAAGAGVYDVKVINLDLQEATSTSAYTYNDAPIIHSNTPSLGPAGGDFTITINGANFSSTTAVLIDTTSCTTVNFVSSSELQCVAPAMAVGTYALKVTNSDQQTFSLANAIEYSLTPASQFEIYSGNLSSEGAKDGTGIGARFLYPTGITSDGTNLFIADYNNHLIRQIVIATGEVTTLAGQARTAGGIDGVGSNATFYNPRNLANDGTNIYVADYSARLIRKIVISTGEVTTLAGQYNVAGDTNGTGSVARFNNPSGVALIGSDLYVTDYTRHVVRKIDTTSGAVTTFAGSPGSSGNTDASGGSARFYNPTGMTTDGTDLYLMEYNGRRFRKITVATAAVTSLAGTYNTNGNTDGIGTTARFYHPQGVTTDGTFAYVADGYYTVRKVVLASNLVTTIAGSYGAVGSLDATGTVAKFGNLFDAEYSGGNLYVADALNGAIRRINTTTLAVDTLAGISGTYGSTDGTRLDARYNYIYGMVNIGKDLYMTDRSNCTIRKLDTDTGIVTTVAGSAGACTYVDGIGSSARLGSPYAMTTDGTYVYFSENAGHRIRRFDPSNGEVYTIAGSGVAGGADGNGTLATFNAPQGLATDGTNLYVTDYTGHIIRKIVLASREVTTIAGSYAVAGSANGIGAVARFYQPQGAVYLNGYVYTVERAGGRVRKIDVSTNEVTSVAGFYNSALFANGTGSLARFSYLSGISTDGTYLYVADNTNHAVRRVEPASGVVTTMMGNPTYQEDSGDCSIDNATIRFPLSINWMNNGLFIGTRTGVFRIH